MQLKCPQCGKLFNRNPAHVNESGVNTCSRTCHLEFVCPNIIGQRFGRLVVIAKTKMDSITRWRCRCDCGKETIVQKASITSGRTQSCGCLQREMASKASKKHGMSHTGIYKIWNAMRQRCENPNVKGFRHYGATGITACKGWLTFDNFFADLGHRPRGKSLDRIDNSLGYFCGHCSECVSYAQLDNCRWATRREQANNTHRNRFVTFNGQIHSIAEWARRLGIAPNTLHTRLTTWSLESAMTLRGKQKRCSNDVAKARSH